MTTEKSDETDGVRADERTKNWAQQKRHAAIACAHVRFRYRFFLNPGIWCQKMNVPHWREQPFIVLTLFGQVSYTCVSNLQYNRYKMRFCGNEDSGGAAVPEP